MADPTDKDLLILNASAGSGKTYRLVQEYILLLIDNDRDLSGFDSIIAMTFTNKAALEMKERIIKALDEISSPEIHGTNTMQLRTDLAQLLLISEEEVNRRCSIVLQNILHRYEEFHILTIDKFNLRLIKSFSRDLDLPSDFEVVMNEKEIIEMIVDQILDEIGTGGDKRLNNLVLKYARSNVEEGRSWNFRRQLVEFGNVLSSERNIHIVEQLLELNLTTEQFGEYHAVKRKWDTAFLDRQNSIRQWIENNPLEKESLPGGQNTINDINGLLKHDRFLTKDELVKSRLAGNLEKGDGDVKHIPSELLQLIISFRSYWHDHLEEYVSIDLYLKNFFNIALLQYIAHSLQEVKKGEQIIRISEFNTLISKLIREEDAPFIYERLGNKFDHFLLDEFQDTSHLQWLNLIPLIHESLSKGKKNLIVGDPKQSIYRFKNGVAEQFIALPGIYNPAEDPYIKKKSAYFNRTGEVRELLDNWRSSSVIVDFNNRFFDSFRNTMSDSARSFYSSIKQHPKRTLNGEVEILSKKKKVGNDELVPRIVQQIEACIADGFKPSDICILGARNKECNAWAMALHDLKYKVVSTDSLLIQSDLEVQLTIAYLNWRYRPAGTNEMKRFGELFMRVKKKPYATYRQFITEITTEEDRSYRVFEGKKFIDTYFENYHSFFFKYENLYDLVQGFIRLMKFDELQNPYLHHLSDVIYSYGLLNGPDLKGFIEEYERTKDKLAVQIPESDDALQIMTIHKSKGLEFPVVIIPALDMSLEIKSSFFLNIEDKIIYKKPSSKDILRPLQALHEQESEQVLIDCINMCYVALTRPKERLYVTNYYDGSKFGATFHSILSSLDGVERTEDELYLHVRSGDHISDSEEERDDLFKPKSIGDRLWFPDIALQDKEELHNETYLSEEMQFGQQFHLLASEVHILDELDVRLDKLINEGTIDRSNRDRLLHDMTQLLNLSEYEQVLAGATAILAEQSILIENAETLRPDLIILKEKETIVIDFKTGNQTTKDQKQVNQYVRLLKTMDYPDVSGYLYYSSKNELLGVN